jgi:glutamate-1-semialdehyde aminotransferase
VTHAVMSRGAVGFDESLLAPARLHEFIPGGAHTYHGGSDQLPEHMTPILVRGHGARVEDLDGNWFVEYGMGLRSVTLGHAYELVVSAVCSAAAEGLTSPGRRYGSCVRQRISRYESLLSRGD